jgi:drug/metabolite transporter (DMT)-like permease
MWIVLSLISAFAVSLRNVFSKASLNKSNEYLTMWITILVSFICSFVIITFTGIEINSNVFWKLLPLRIFLDSVAFFLFIKAMKMKSVSLVIPLLAFTPIISMIGAYLINNQPLKFLGIVGILIVVLGSSIIFITEVNFKNVKNNGELMTATAFTLIAVSIWGILDSIHSREIAASNPYTYFFISSIFFLIIFSILAYIYGRKGTKEFFNKSNLTLNLPLGIFLTFEFIMQLLAFERGPIAYVSALKSTNIGISFILALIFLKEGKGFLKTMIKFIGLLVSLFGVMIIVLN